MKKLITLISILALQFAAMAQVPGTWVEHFSFREVTQLETIDDNIFALSNNGIFVYNTNTKEITKITKLNGLSSVGLTSMAYCDSTSSFLVGYSDGTLDIIPYPSLTNIETITTIAKKNIYGSKQINQICIQNDTAFLATGIGVITFSIRSKKFISFTIFSQNGDIVPAKSVTFNNGKIFAATTNGIYSINADNSNLSDFSNWTKLTGIPYENDTIDYLATLDETVYYSHLMASDASKDSVYKITNNSVERFKTQPGHIKSLRSRNGFLSIASDFSSMVYSADEKIVCLFDTTNTSIRDYTDIIKAQDNTFWVSYGNSGISSPQYNTTVLPQGPYSNLIADIKYSENKLYMAAGNLGLWSTASFSLKLNSGEWYGHDNWKYTNSFCVCVAPKSKKYYYGSMGQDGDKGTGLVECSNSWWYDTVYTTENSPIKKKQGEKFAAIYDVESDSKENIWMVNYGTSEPLIVKDNTGKWYSYQMASTKYLYKKVFIDSRNYKWLSGASDVKVFYDNNTLDDTSDDLITSISLSDSEGKIAELSTCVTEDLTGEIWVGTTQGIAVHSSPSRVFKDRKTISRIKIEIDGEVGYLLSSEAINCIAVDGGNRKWVGTANSGIFLLSENGTEQILNFTKTNSPLPSNNITSLAIDHKTGEVFIGTEAGLVSYISNATGGSADMTDAYIFPNPVRESYTGNIFIKGIVANATIKITDVSGNFVTNVEANGGTAEWDGRNIYGERVSTGVYLLYISDENGENTKVMKLLFIH